MTGIQNSQGIIGFDAGIHKACDRFIIAVALAIFRTKIFDCFVIQQTVDRFGIGLGITVIHAATNANPPLRRLGGKAHIEENHQHSDKRIAPVKLIEHDSKDQRKFDNGRDRCQHGHSDDGFDATASALQHTGQAARLLFQMEAQGQAMHVLEGFQRQSANGMHGHGGKQRIPHLC